MGILACLLPVMSSCVQIEMRDSLAYAETEEEFEEAPVMLAQAEKRNVVMSALEYGTEEAVEYTEELKTVKFSFAGRLGVDEHILSDASMRAADGKSYSFLKMYAGVWGEIKNADCSACFTDGENLPAEYYGALGDLGVELVCTDSAQNAVLSDYGYESLGLGGEPVTEDIDGITFASVLFGDKDSARPYDGENVSSDIEYADLVSDVVIVFVDWGSGVSENEMKTAAYKIAEAGADIIIGCGDTLADVEFLDTGDGSLTLAAYSLGSLLTTSDSADNLIGGILELSVTSNGEGSPIGIEDVTLIPTFTHYSGEYGGYQVFKISEYSDTLAEYHRIGSVSANGLKADVIKKVSADFLPDDYKN